MASFLTDLAKPYVEKLINGAIAESSYMCCFTCIAKDFEEERVGFERDRTTVKELVDQAIRRGDNVQDNVRSWEKEADELIQEDTKAKQKCLFGFCPDCIWRYRRGKDLANKKEKIKKLIETRKDLVIGLPAHLPDVERYSSKHYISFESREFKYKELLDALKDDNNYITGLQGMGGIGKTTLAKEVGKELKESKQFTCVIDTTVSLSPDIKKIQDDIAGPLGLDFKDCSESDRPRKLWKRLTNGEKILLILDDVWGDINFDEIGIPDKDNHKSCRILITTRKMSVCNKLDCSKIVRLKILSEKDAWTMFKKHAGLSGISTKDLLDKGQKISNECKGLPIAIAAMASSLKGTQSPEEWDGALKSLQKPMSMLGVDDELHEIYKCFQVSYDNLKNDTAKGLFLICSVFREDEEISNEMLTRFAIGAGLFGEDYDSYEDARSQVVSPKKKLLDSCLLLEAGQSKVKMHDLVRDAAPWIANKEIQTVRLYRKNQKVGRQANIKYLSCEGKLKDVFSMKLDGSKLEILIVSVHQDEDCHDVKIEVPNSFFENCMGLRVFHLSFNFNYLLDLSLPQSIQSLKNIRSLLFTYVNLGDISILENLQSLETLDLDDCKIDELPHGITKLQKLRLLNLNYCRIARNNPFEVIEGCSSLEELYFRDSFNNFCKEITFPKFQRFYIDDWSSKDISVSKCVSFVLEDDVYLSETTLKYCMQEAEVLRLRRIEGGWRNIIPEIVPLDHGMNDLIELDLRSTSQLQCLIDTKHIESQVSKVFSKLVVLNLDGMDNLEELLNGPLSFDSLNSLEKLSISDCKHLKSLFKCKLNLFNLKSVSLRGCPMLISIFELSTASSLVLLEKLKIYDCELLENILTDDHDNTGGNDWGTVFPRLKELNVCKCEQLEYIFGHTKNHLHLPALETFIIRNLPSLVAMCPKQYRTAFPSLKELNCSQVAIKSIADLITCHSVTRSVKDGTINKEFHENMDHCLNEINEQQMNLGLEIITLHVLPMMTCLFVGPKNSISLQNLTELKILRCEKLKMVFSTSIIRCLPQLLYMRIQECNELKHIIEDDLVNKKSSNFMSTTKTCFPKLNTIFVVKCNKLKYVFPISICKELPELKSLIITEANELEEIFVSEGDDQKVEIPNLKFVVFENLPSLSHAQGIQYQAVKYRFIQNCQNLSLASASTAGFINDLYGLYSGSIGYDYRTRKYLMKLFMQSHFGITDYTVNPDEDNWEGLPRVEAVATEAAYLFCTAAKEATEKDAAKTITSSPHSKSLSSSSGHLATSKHKTTSKELMNEQRSLGEIDAANKSSEGNNLEGSTSEKLVSATSSTTLGTKNEPPIQLVSPKQKGIEISVEEGIASTREKTHLEVGDGKICIPSFSIGNTKPPSTKDVDIGDSPKTTHVFYDSAKEDIDMLIEEDPLLALENLLNGVQSFSIEILVQELKTLMDSSSDLDHLVSNQESKSKLISLFHGLNQHQGLLPSDVKEFVEKVQNFFIDNIIKHTNFQRALKKHNQLLDSKVDLKNKLQSAKSTQNHIESKSSTSNAQIHELSLQIDELRKKLEDLEKRRDDLKSEVNTCDIQKSKLKAECAEWAQQSKELLSALASSEVDLREAELARKLAKEGFANLKSSFPTF